MKNGPQKSTLPNSWALAAIWVAGAIGSSGLILLIQHFGSDYSKVLTVLRYISLALSGIAGFIAVVGNNRDGSGRVTMVGHVVLMTVIISFIVSSTTQFVETRKDRDTIATNLEQTQHVLYEINRTLHSLGEFTVSIDFDISIIKNTPSQTAQYQVDEALRRILPNHSRDASWHDEGISYYNNTMPTEYLLDAKTFPDLAYAISGVNIDVIMYKSDLQKEAELINKNLIPAPSDWGFFAQIQTPRNKIGMSVYYPTDQKFRFDVQEIVPSFRQSMGKVMSVLDILGTTAIVAIGHPSGPIKINCLRINFRDGRSIAVGEYTDFESVQFTKMAPWPTDYYIVKFADEFGIGPVC